MRTQNPLGPLDHRRLEDRALRISARALTMGMTKGKHIFKRFSDSHKLQQNVSQL